MAGIRVVALVASLAAIALIAGCGGGSSDSSGGGGSGQGSSGNVTSFGRQASPADRAAATRSVQEFLKAWRDRDSARACALMAATTKQNLAVFASQLKSSGCPGQVEAVRASMPDKMLARFRGFQFTGMRTDGNRGFLLYRDAQGTSSSFPVVREGAAWKVGAIAGTRIP
jgi:hypothetical protein